MLSNLTPSEKVDLYAVHSNPLLIFLYHLCSSFLGRMIVIIAQVVLQIAIWWVAILLFIFLTGMEIGSVSNISIRALAVIVIGMQVLIRLVVGTFGDTSTEDKVFEEACVFLAPLIVLAITVIIFTVFTVMLFLWQMWQMAFFR